MNATLASPRAGLPAGVGVIDADVHAHVPSIDALAPWLDSHWREVAVTTQFRGPTRHRLPAERGRAASRPEPRGRPWHRRVGHRPARTGARPLGRRGGHPALRLRRRGDQEPRRRGRDGGRGERLAHRRVARARSPACAGRSSCRGWSRRTPPTRSTGRPSTRASCRSRCRCARSPRTGNRLCWPLLEAVTRHDLVLALQFGARPAPADVGRAGRRRTSRSTSTWRASSRPS